MTVEDLIRELTKMPRDAIVFDVYGCSVSVVSCEDDGNNGWRVVIEHS